MRVPALITVAIVTLVLGSGPAPFAEEHRTLRAPEPRETFPPSVFAWSCARLRDDCDFVVAYLEHAVQLRDRYDHERGEVAREYLWMLYQGALNHAAPRVEDLVEAEAAMMAFAARIHRPEPTCIATCWSRVRPRLRRVWLDIPYP